MQAAACTIHGVNGRPKQNPNLPLCDLSGSAAKKIWERIDDALSRGVGARGPAAQLTARSVPHFDAEG